MIGNCVLSYTAINWIRACPVVTTRPRIAHDVPFVVIRLVVIARGMRQPQSMAHLMPDHGYVFPAPRGFPGHIPRLSNPVQGQEVAAAPGTTTLTLQDIIEHQVDAHIRRKIHTRVGNSCTIRGSLIKVKPPTGA